MATAIGKLRAQIIKSSKLYGYCLGRWAMNMKWNSSPWVVNANFYFSAYWWQYFACSDAVKYLVEVLADLEESERTEATEQVWASISKQKCEIWSVIWWHKYTVPLISPTSSCGLISAGLGLVTREQCEQAVLECTGQGRDGSVKLFDVINAYDIPKYTYDIDHQNFTK